MFAFLIATHYEGLAYMTSGLANRIQMTVGSKILPNRMERKQMRSAWTEWNSGMSTGIVKLYRWLESSGTRMNTSSIFGWAPKPAVEATSEPVVDAAQEPAVTVDRLATLMEKMVMLNQSSDKELKREKIAAIDRHTASNERIAREDHAIKREELAAMLEITQMKIEARSRLAKFAAKENEKLLDKRLEHSTIENNKNRNLMCYNNYNENWAKHGVITAVRTPSDIRFDSAHALQVFEANAPEDITQEQRDILTKAVAHASGFTKLADNSIRVTFKPTMLKYIKHILSNQPVDLSYEDQQLVVVDNPTVADPLKKITEINQKKDDEEETADESEDDIDVSEFTPIDIEDDSGYHMVETQVDDESKKRLLTEMSRRLDQAEGEIIFNAITYVSKNKQVLRYVFNHPGNKSVITKASAYHNYCCAELSTRSSIRTASERQRDQYILKRNPKKSMPRDLVPLMKSKNNYN